jgi:hypothetical protein
MTRSGPGSSIPNRMRAQCSNRPSAWPPPWDENGGVRRGGSPCAGAWGESPIIVLPKRQRSRRQDAERERQASAHFHTNRSSPWPPPWDESGGVRRDCPHARGAWGQSPHNCSLKRQRSRRQDAERERQASAHFHSNLKSCLHAAVGTASCRLRVFNVQRPHRTRPATGYNTFTGTTGFDRERRTRIASRGAINLVNQVANHNWRSTTRPRRLTRR